ncbi:hypothetical protein ROS9278_00217 [Roseomonas sp. CECT 9278]|nr:hypothetical protein ROS9278_00217 [Roseomonas sp. CECT 9278]
MQHQPAPFWRSADEFQRPVLHENKAEGRIAGEEKLVAPCQSDITAGWKGAEEIEAHVTAII